MSALLLDFLPQTLFLSGNLVPQVNPAFKPKWAENNLDDSLKEDPLKILGENVEAWKSAKQAALYVDTPLQRFYSVRNILITGGTGFVGKVLIQKLIRSFPNIGHIYLIVREKRGVTPQKRLQSLLEDKLFLRMQTEVPQYLSKIRVLQGDITEPGLGLTAEHRQMLIDKVNLIFHVAANVKFNEPLKSCLQSNLVGSRRIIDLAKEMHNLKAYVHISTAYSHCVRRVIEEKCYTVNVNYADVLRYTEGKTQEEIDEETPRLLQGWPNTYTFSKALTEDMIQAEAKDLPICIYRPTVVMPTYKDPVKGWTDNVYGATGVLLAMVLGIIHIFRANLELALDLVPVDSVVNSLIAVAADVANTRNSGEIPVYNFASTPNNYITWKRLNELFMKYGNSFPSEKTVWYSFVFFPESKFLDNLGHFFLHKIPGKILDMLATAVGDKPRLSKLYEKIDFLKRKLSFFGFGVWEFHNENVTLLWNKLDEADQKMFPFDFADVKFDRFMIKSELGVRYYFLKEQMETLVESARKFRWLKCAHYVFVTVVGLFVVKVAALTAHALPV